MMMMIVLDKKREEIYLNVKSNVMFVFMFIVIVVWIKYFICSIIYFIHSLFEKKSTTTTTMKMTRNNNNDDDKQKEPDRSRGERVKKKNLLVKL